MKHTYRYFTAIAAAALTLSGCQKEGSFSDGEFGGDAVVRFVPSVSGSSSATHTKGTLYNETLSPVSLGEYVSEFMVTAYNMPSEGDPVKFIPDATASAFEAGFTADGYQKVMKRDGEDETEYWMTVQPSDATVADDEYIWKKNEVKTFYAYANLPAGEAATVASADATGQTLEYTVPATASAQTDILLGYYYGQGKTGSPAEQTGTAGIVFQHPLTAVRFIYGTITDNPDIRSIRLDGVAQRGTATMSPVEDHPESATIEWSGVDAYTHTVSQTKESGLPVASSVPKLIGEPFLLIPQDVAANHVTVTVTFTNSTSVSATIPAASPSGKWDAGKTNTYTINFDANACKLTVNVTAWNAEADVELPLEEDNSLLKGKFSISATEYVQFSKGNLYCTRFGTTTDNYTYSFDFEANQYDFRTRPGSISVQGGVVGTTETNMSGLFQWNQNCTAGSDYGAFSTTATISGATSDTFDWGPAVGNGWSTLSAAEWSYLIDYRPGNRYAWATVNGVVGMIIFPDGWTDTHSIGINGINYTYPDYKDQTITPENWKLLESDGAVFLPAAGESSGADISYVGKSGNYWSSTADNSNVSNSWYLTFNGLTTMWCASRSFGNSVRLVKKSAKPNSITYVDLGLPSGTLWADMNIGATTETGPGSYGDLFAFGETNACGEAPSPYIGWDGTKNSNYSGLIWKSAANYSDTYYKWGSNVKYNMNSGGLSVLQPEDDAAVVRLNDGSHIPTLEQWNELRANCTSKREDKDGINGYRITGPNGKTIYLPMSGIAAGSTGISMRNAEGDFAVNSLSDYQRAHRILVNTTNSFFNSGYFDFACPTYYGISVRPVKEAEFGFVDLGLPSGTQWANMNLGAKEVSDPGNYYVWGDIGLWYQSITDNNTVTMKSDYSGGFESAVYTEKGMLKNVTDKNLTGEFAQYDAAYAYSGGEYRMPSGIDVTELWYNTNHSQTPVVVNGVNCMKFENRNDASKFIIIPMGGNLEGTSVKDYNSRFRVWTSDCYDATHAKRFGAEITSGVITTVEYSLEHSRYKASPIRPVKTAPTE